MILSDTSIKRPVFATMVILALVLFGIISFRQIGVDLFPKVEIPGVTIVAVLPGADPETVETTVTDPIEEAVSSISGIKELRSTSADSVSQVVVSFELEKNVDVAYQEIQARLGTIRSQLPQDLHEPVVEKFDVDAAPILSVVVSGDKPIRELTYIADKVIKERLQRVRNVGQVKLVGGRQRNMWLWLDRNKLEGYRLAVQDIEQALRTEHVEVPGGRVESGLREYAVKTRAEFDSARQFSEMVVAWRGGAPVRVRDIGRVEDGLEEERSMARLNDTRAIALQVRRQSGTNTVEVAKGIKAEVERLRKELGPQGIGMEIAQDLSVFIEHSIREIQFHLVVGGLLAVFIVWVFLRNLRITLISAIAIPTSVISTFALMQWMGFTMNNLTMLALSLSIGLLIDDAIVVVENIFRHVEEGKPPREAAGFGTAEIGLAALAITLSIVAVFLPVAFMKGIIGRFFYQFGLTVTFAVSISLFVAFTVVPMLASRFLHHEPKHSWLYRVSGRVLDALDAGYGALLRAALNWRAVTVLVAVVVMAGALLVARRLPSEFIPAEDSSEFGIQVKAPLGASLQATSRILETVRQKLVGQPWLAYTYYTIGADNLQRVNEGSMYVKMVPKAERTLGQTAAMGWAREQLASIPDARISVGVVPRIGGGGHANADLMVELRGRELEQLERYAARLTAKMRESGAYLDVDTSYEKGKPELDVYVKRNEAGDLGVSPISVATTVRALIGGVDVSKFRAQGDRYDVSLRLAETYRNRPEDIDRLSVRTQRGELVRLQSVARVQAAGGPVQINRYNRARQITVLANLDRNQRVLGEAITEVGGMVKELDLAPGYTSGFAGMADVMRESFGYLLFALFLAVIMVYMVLAAQFESFLHPLTIMLALPLSAVGAFGALALAKMTISIFTMIGFIMLMGLVTKNAILLVDYTNTLRHRDGMERNAALLKAGPIRLRPILMTTFAMIFGMLPIALGTGEGSESRGPMAMAVIGGLITSTLLTLVVVPVIYTLMDDLQNWRTWRIWRRRPGSAAREPAARAA
ncbi:MAG: efflux RND transporter permease subunit [Candidatus Lambdaproteobacteria bacterium]|nr:efflux RND transporter permease subunit [Candidatus Lambdaproteobacteria bacterium]